MKEDKQVDVHLAAPGGQVPSAASKGALCPEHTPGPWFFGIAYEPKEGERPPSYTGPGYYNNPGILSAASGETIVGCDEYDVFGPSLGEREANIQLIAAAPELLEALRRIEARCPTDSADYTRGSIGDIARAAIAKATGSNHD